MGSEISDRSVLLLHRFQKAFDLGIWNGRKWHCADIQGQVKVARSLTRLLDSISKENLPNSILKDLANSGVMALVSILEYKNSTVLGIASKTALRLITVLPAAVLQLHALELVSPLSSLLELHQLEISILCAKALNLMFSSPALLRNDKEVWEILTRSDMIRHAISDISKVEKMELFTPMALLLSTTLQRWPLSRFPLYSNAVSVSILIDILAKPDSIGKAEALNLLSSIALCGSGATKLLENGESLLRRIVTCMEISQPFSVRIGGFRLARRLAINEERFFKMAGLCCEPLVQAIICGMGTADGRNLRIFSREPIPLIRKACRLALITRWEGKHHALFWKHGIGFVLLDLLNPELFQNYSSFEKEAFGVSSLQNYVLDILGWLAIHCEYDFNPVRETKRSIDKLIKLACSNFGDAIRNSVFSNDFSLKWYTTRAFFMMIYSPCKYIASKAKAELSKLTPCLRAAMLHLEEVSSLNDIPYPRVELPLVMAVACVIGSPEYQYLVIEFSGLNLLVTLARRYLENHVDFETVREPYSYRKKSCCAISSEEGWEGKYLVMFYTLWGLAVLIQDLDRVRIDGEIPELIELLQDICVRMPSHGVRWLSSYALSYLGLYGFPNTFQKKVGIAIRDIGHEDMRFVFSNGESLSAHGIALAVHCPPLLRLEGIHLENEKSGEIQREIRLSNHVDQQLLLKILDYVYLGYLQTEEGDTKLLRAMAKLCNLGPLMQVLRRERPKWGTPYPTFDLSVALGPLGYQFSDVVLEVEMSEAKNWKCDFCSSSVPHFHAHKAILASVCPYMRALFYSNMQESFLQRVKLDLVSYEAMAKLVAWFYTNNLPTAASGCIWHYMSDEEKIDELKPYVELCWLSDYWVCEDLKEACLPLVISRLNSAHQLSIKIIKMAALFNMSDLVNVAVELASPLYRQFQDSGELEDLDEAIVHKIRSASVQRTQSVSTETSERNRLLVEIIEKLLLNLNQ